MAGTVIKKDRDLVSYIDIITKLGGTLKMLRRNNEKLHLNINFEVSLLELLLPLGLGPDDAPLFPLILQLSRHFFLGLPIHLLVIGRLSLAFLIIFS